jgi:UDP-2,3-diacylglucosamine pyrophosphatase LpxH
MNEKLLFISDVHAGGFSQSQNEVVEKCFIQVLLWAKKNEYHVYFLGDIFDYWMEFKSGYYPKEFDSIIETIVSLKKENSHLIMITGNHDNWTADFFHSKGITIEENYQSLVLPSNGKVLLMHGDGLLERNGIIKRPIFHQILRNKQFIKLFQFLFPDQLGLSVMKKFSIWNRKTRPTKDSSAIKLTKWFKTNFSKLGYDTVICGHDHIPRVIRDNNLKYLNLGAFFTYKTFAIYTENEFKLVFWDEQENQPKLFESTDL